MQLNIYVPKKRAAVVERLGRTARRLGRAKGEVVLDAIEAYLRHGGESETDDDLDLPVYDLGLGSRELPSRSELHGEWLDTKYAKS